MGIDYSSRYVVRDFADMGPNGLILFNDIRSITIGGQYATIHGIHPSGEEQMLRLHAETEYEQNKLKELMKRLDFHGAITYERY